MHPVARSLLVDVIQRAAKERKRSPINICLEILDFIADARSASEIS
jgi:hypothetical protein